MKNFDLSKIAIKEIKDVYNYTIPENSYGSAKTANNVLIIKRSGNSVYRVGDRELIADSNNILFIPKDTEYSIEVENKGACIVIEFDICDTQIELCCGEYFFNNSRDILTTAKNILHYWSLKGPAFEVKCLSEMYSIITQIATMDSYANTLAGKYRMIHKSIKYIETNYSDCDLYTTQLAEISEIGETYYRNIFISVFNMPPTKYIQMYRIEKAKELLASTELSLDEIALKVGFANSSYLCKVFKTTVGITPLAFAKKARYLG
jgi:AraC-like DNA-binding protein